MFVGSGFGLREEQAYLINIIGAIIAIDLKAASQL